MNSIDRLRELGKHTEPCIWTADDVKSAVMIEKETFDKCLDNIEREVAAMVPLPLDADGEPIHVGDVMENIVCPPVHREVTGVGVECFYGWDEGNGRYSQFDVACYRHHHAPTVEDVLEEFVARWMETHHDDIPALKAEYAARLRLAEGGDE